MKYKLVYANWEKLHELPDDRKLLCEVMFGKVLEDNPEYYDTVFEGETDDPTKLPDELFERFNIGDRGGKHVRSMSVGDLVIFEDGRAVVCAPVGWKETKSPIQA